MTELTGIAKTIFDEVMDEILEEITEGLEDLILADILSKIIKDIQEKVSSEVKTTILEIYSEDMTTIKKMILGEKLSRIVITEVKDAMQSLVSQVLKKSFNVVDELRKEVIGEVFEETARD